MIRFLWNFAVRTAGTALALWLVTLVFSKVSVSTPDGATDRDRILVFLGIAVVIGFVNAVVEPILKVIGFPITLVTLGAFLVVINAFVFWLAEPISQSLGLGLHIDGVWAAVWGAALMSIAQWLISPLTGILRRKKKS